MEASLTLSAAYDTVSTAASHDALTGLLNRRGWDEAVGRATERCTRQPGASVCIVAADLDGLKYVNDTFGHGTGDALIVGFARLLTRVAPPGSLAARVGGDEFAVLVVGDQPCDGDLLLARLRAHLQDGELINGVRLSASLGWAGSPPLPTVLDAIRAADDAAGLDKQRRRGRRRSDPPPR